MFGQGNSTAGNQNSSSSDETMLSFNNGKSVITLNEGSGLFNNRSGIVSGRISIPGVIALGESIDISFQNAKWQNNNLTGASFADFRVDPHAAWRGTIRGMKTILQNNSYTAGVKRSDFHWCFEPVG